MATRDTAAGLRPGFHLGVAPRFHVSRHWSSRFEVNSGLERDAAGWFPRRDWRCATADEVAALVEDEPGGAEPAPRRDGGLLFNVPRHLVDLWWKAADEIEAGAAGGGAYERFVDDVVAFLGFKQMPLPQSCAFDVRVSRPGQRSTRLDAGGAVLHGLGFDAFDGAPARRTVAWVNLGEEDSRFVYLNLPAASMSALIGQGGSSAGGDLLRRFATTRPSYPLVRLRLAPGEGLWFPDAPIVHDGDTQGKLDLDVVLTLTAAE